MLLILLLYIDHAVGCAEHVGAPGCVGRITSPLGVHVELVLIAAGIQHQDFLPQPLIVFFHGVFFNPSIVEVAANGDLPGAWIIQQKCDALFSFCRPHISPPFCG